MLTAHTWDSVPGDVDSKRVTWGWGLPSWEQESGHWRRMRRKEAAGAQSSSEYGGGTGSSRKLCSHTI